MDNLFVDETIIFDFLTKNQLEMELYVRDLVNQKQLGTIR